MPLTLHNYFRSSTSTRLRAALNLKGLDYDNIGYSLLDQAHKTPEFLSKNPAGLVPVLELAGGTQLTQSLAIIEYLDEVHPNPPLLPDSALARARVRGIAQMIACDIHPVNNLRILQYLETEFGRDAETRAHWFRHWVAQTFAPLEATLAASPDTGDFCHGDAPGLADICLFAQVLNNRRFGVNMAPYPTINRIFDAVNQIEAFQRAAPENQPDAK